MGGLRRPRRPTYRRRLPQARRAAAAAQGSLLARAPCLEKAGTRGLFVAESFAGGGRGRGRSANAAAHAAPSRSSLAGVVMRRDLVIDGFALGSAELGGDDATGRIAAMHAGLGRADIGLIAVSGTAISLYNIVDLHRLRDESGVPAIGVSYGEAAAGGDALAGRLAGDAAKAALFRRQGPRTRVRLHTSHDLFVRCAGCTAAQAGRLLNSMTVQGAVPEPLRIARLLARAARAARAAPLLL